MVQADEDGVAGEKLLRRRTEVILAEIGRMRRIGPMGRIGGMSGGD